MLSELMAVYIAIINSFVHQIMYSYYLLSSFKHEDIQNIVKRIKPCITVVQLIQFGIIVIHCIVAILPECNLSYFFYVQIVNFIALTYLFGKFFVESFIVDNKHIKVQTNSPDGKL